MRETLTIQTISIHALRKESDRRSHGSTLPATLISIHALRKESDNCVPFSVLQRSTFQSTLSVRRATVGGVLRGCQRFISIHALRKESDGP